MISGRVLVTGGAGFIGSHIVDRLLTIPEVEEVIVLDDLSTGKLENLSRNLRNPKLRFVKGDVRSEDLVDSIVRDVNYIFHEAAIVSVELSLRDPVKTNDVNVGGTINLLSASLKNEGLERFVYASSCAVYGDPERFPIDEECKTEPLSPYGASKVAAEKYIGAFHFTYGLKTVSLRYFNVYGPGQGLTPYSRVISIFLNRAVKGEPLIIYGDGLQSRDFVYVEDVVDANLLAASKDEAVGKTINIGSGVETTIKDLASTVIDLTGRVDLEVIYKPPRRGDIRRSIADIGRAKAILGYEPRTRLEEGLMKVLRSIQEGTCGEA